LSAEDTRFGGERQHEGDLPPDFRIGDKLRNWLPELLPIFGPAGLGFLHAVSLRAGRAPLIELRRQNDFVIV
jgi:hypothetical protein